MGHPSTARVALAAMMIMRMMVTEMTINLDLLTILHLGGLLPKVDVLEKFETKDLVILKVKIERRRESEKILLPVC